MVSLRDRTKLAKPKRLIDEIDNGPRKKQKGNTRPATSAAYPIVAAPVLLPADQDEALALEPAAAPNNYTAPTCETAPTSSAGSISPTSDNALLTGPHSGTSPRSPYLDPSSGPAAAPTIPPAPTCENASASSAGSISNPGDNPRGNPNGPPDGSPSGGGDDGSGRTPSDQSDRPPSLDDSPGSPSPDPPNPPANPKPNPRGPNAGWHSLPTELHFRIFSYIDIKYTLKRIPASARSTDEMFASYSGWVFNSGIQALGRAYYHEIRRLTMEHTARSWEHTTNIVVHWDCVDQIFPLMSMVRQICESDLKWTEMHGETQSQSWKDTVVTLPIIEYLQREIRGTINKSYAILSTIERDALEDFVRIVVCNSRIMHDPSKQKQRRDPFRNGPPYKPERIWIRVLLPQRDSFHPAAGSELSNLLGPEYNDPNGYTWAWPDPCRVKGKLEQIARELHSHPLFVSGNLDFDYLGTFDDVWNDNGCVAEPKVPLMSSKHRHTRIRSGGSEEADERVLFARMEQIRAAAAVDDSA
jgi:hypothetical protein